jgi:hypothetical protein
MDLESAADPLNQDPTRIRSTVKKLILKKLPHLIYIVQQCSLPLQYVNTQLPEFYMQK